MMGVLPLQFVDGEDADSLGFDGSETFDIQVGEDVMPGHVLDAVATNQDGKKTEFKVKARFDSEVEVDYYRNGGILQLVLRNKLKEQ
jgi:aconitate hydratase